MREDWMTRTWRPMMGIAYIIICLFDFVLGPVFFNLLQYNEPSHKIEMWTSLTLQNGGLFHLSMGAILGVSAYGRSMEKIACGHIPSDTK